LAQIRPGIARIAVIWNSASVAMTTLSRNLFAAAEALNQQLLPVRVQTSSDIEPALAGAAQGGAAALIYLADGLLDTAVGPIVSFANAQRWPTVAHVPSFVNNGGLLSYGANALQNDTEAAVLLNQVLKG